MSSSGSPRVKIKQKDRHILGSCQRAEKAVKQQDEGDNGCTGCPWNCAERPPETGELIDTIQTTRLLKSAKICRRHLMRSSVTQTSEKPTNKTCVKKFPMPQNEIKKRELTKEVDKQNQ